MHNRALDTSETRQCGAHLSVLRLSLLHAHDVVTRDGEQLVEVSVMTPSVFVDDAKGRIP